MSWTDERVELLEKLRADGLPASQIAAELGGVTRNAVLGKLDRLARSRRRKTLLNQTIEIPVEQRKTLLQLTEKTCRWPLGDPKSAEFFFCGGDTVNELPYCSCHARVAYLPRPGR